MIRKKQSLRWQAKTNCWVGFGNVMQKRQKLRRWAKTGFWAAFGNEYKADLTQVD